MISSTGLAKHDPSVQGKQGSKLTASGDGPSAEAERRLMAVRSLSLQPYVLELETQGYTVVPPELVAPPKFIDRVRNAILRVAEQRTGVKHAVERNGAYGKYRDGPVNLNQFILYYMLFEDSVFEEWLENPILTVLVNYTLKGRAHLSHMAAFVKWRDEGDGDKWTVPLHTDSPDGPEGTLLGGGDLICNCTLVLTDYAKQHGALAIVPGSHSHCRRPNPGEAAGDAIPVEAQAGSMIFWRGGTWHGAYPKTTDGLRITLMSYFSDRMLKTLERYQRAVPKEMLDRHGEQFARYVGADDPWGRGIAAEPTYLSPPKGLG